MIKIKIFTYFSTLFPLYSKKKEITKALISSRIGQCALWHVNESFVSYLTHLLSFISLRPIIKKNMNFIPELVIIVQPHFFKMSSTPILNLRLK